MAYLLLSRIVGNKIISDMVDNESILSAALIDTEGFTIERTSSEFRPNTMAEFIDLSQGSQTITLIGENSTVIISKLETGHSIAIQCPNDGNLGKARQKLARACEAILPFL